jgi:hypothetical protein
MVRIDATAVAHGGPREVRGAANWVKGAAAFSRSGQLASARPAIVNGAVGVVLPRHGRLFRALRFMFRGGRIARIDIERFSNVRSVRLQADLKKSG